MQQAIMEKLAAIKEQYNIEILFACESGSRGWQCPSPDSDYDVRFIYIRPSRYYMSVANQGYDLNFPINDELDIYGWDLKKLLQLMLKSNTTPFEWLQSPIVYDQRPGFRDDLWALSQHFFSQRSNIHHYLGIVTGAFKSIDQEGMISIKKLFYVLRPLLAAKWCLEKDNIAPMTVSSLMELMPARYQQEAQVWLRKKAGRKEGSLIRMSESLRSYIEQQFLDISNASRALESNYFKPDQLDEFFIKTILDHDN
ncbi:nucleotidyltransferase domain-containing protein [Paraflavitalea sp. CAU 1676]|uniref:nucleotidyltransferase domain-containing protein n=1 Tax=Paraflavitalea sp. CAU 1676 TaxID=3032598 RepID=UPI0023DB45F3|nr:nucleotidyltransferase domain-containing protein [Paraflavitalea sp. CAU 1676]MDF2191189.1 nucleotidyltransferase domain-containing protein [Paraflavitalea sp. CAU 1676]